ncbi:MAG: sugar ABC transporter permease [Clostridiales bacterium]|jgi:putative aldouronate transport system permease protein|nr:sugar ABC transporter permease [Clostridiales bacterium]
MVYSSKEIRKKRAKLNRTDALHIMLIPAVVFTFIFYYLPLFGIVMAFQNFKPLLGFTKSEWVGFEQFRYIFTIPSFWIACRNTFIIAFFKIILNIIVPLTLSLLLNELIGNKFKRFVQTIIFIPYFFSWAILGGMVIEIFSYDGAINNLIAALGGEPIAFLISNAWFRPIIIASDVWKNIGYNTVLFLAAITNIDPTLYEAAVVDGAGRFKQLTKITLPSIASMIVLLTILGLGGILNAGFEQIFIMYNPIVEKTVDIIDTFVYRLGIVSTQYSAAAAAGLFKSVVSMVFVGASYWLAYKTTEYRVF